MLEIYTKCKSKFKLLKTQFFPSLILFFVSFSSYSKSVHTICNGNWSNSTTWDSGVPISTDSVIIDHDVILDIDVILTIPGKLIIHGTGSLCGYHDFIGSFYTDGPMSVYSLTVTGPSISNALVIAAGWIFISSSWLVNGGALIGAAFTCSTPIPCIPPIVAFGVNQYYCVGQNITLNNTSLYAVINNWSMPGANITSSSALNPVIHYDLPGTYTITLICSNSYGVRYDHTYRYHQHKTIDRCNERYPNMQKFSFKFIGFRNR